ncbi:hypothetical protein BKA63DRAFT_528061 [Paraphoma chrysanthemicola]|nr:hypothetical protein BKA63DRAFT_528061 [Paraphoma chrysanthemicola]
MSSSVFTALESPTKIACRYIDAYNAIDLGGVRALLHPIKFQFSHHNWAAYAASAEDFVSMLDRMAKDTFPNRQFTHIHAIHAVDDVVLLDTSWKATPIVTIPGGSEAGVEFSMNIKSFIVVEEGLITEIRDHN